MLVVLPVVPLVVPLVVVPTVVPVVVEPAVVPEVVPVVVVPASVPVVVVPVVVELVVLPLVLMSVVEPEGASVLVEEHADRAAPRLMERARDRTAQADFCVKFIGVGLEKGLWFQPVSFRRLESPPTQNHAIELHNIH